MSSILIYNSSGNPPSVNMVGHYDASIISSIHIGTGVSQWDDLSGMSHHLLQGTAASQPVFSGLGTTSKVTFDGSNDYMTTTFSLFQPQMVYVVMSIITWSNNKNFFDGLTFLSMAVNMSGTSPSAVYATSNASTKFYGGTNLNLLTTSTFQVIAGSYATAGGTLSCNDGIKLSGTINSLNDVGGFTLGARGGALLNSNISVKEVFLYNDTHSAATQTSIITYLRTKWGI